MVSLRDLKQELINKNKPMEALKQRILEHIADLLDEPTFELDMRLADCIDPLPSDKSELHLLMTDAAFKAFCTYFNKQDNTEQCTINGVVKSLPIDEIQDYHIKRWANGLETGASMQEIREDMEIAKKAIDLGNTLQEREIK